MEGDPALFSELDDVPGPDGFVSLSTFQPSSTDPVDGYWRSSVKYGRLAPEFHDAAVFKRPQVMLEPGACFRTGPSTAAPLGRTGCSSMATGNAWAHRGVHPVQAVFAAGSPNCLEKFNALTGGTLCRYLTR